MEYIYKKIGSIVFGLLGPDEIKKMASVKIVTPELYDKEGYSVDGGLMDTHLGVIDPGLRCRTCGGKLKECIGHFGYIELARPIVHINYVKIILDVLRSTCGSCGSVLLDKNAKEALINELNEIEKEKGATARRRRVREIINMLKNIKKCPGCGEKQYNIKIEKPSSFYEKDKRLTPIEVRARLAKVLDEDCILLGLNPRFARPEWTILTVMPIPPVTIRPSITLETGERSEDDLTHKLGDIVRINQRLFENINAGAPEIIIEDLWDLLQYHITTYFDNEIAQVPPARHRSGQVLKTLSERIKSKEGRFRHNLAGKRVNYAARTVISPDPEANFNEVGVPKSVALELTVPERVTEWNKEWLKKLIENGSDKYPGANYVITADGKKKRITDETKEQILNELTEGYVVERHLINGDIAIFNRQPSLHRMSIMCHKVRVMQGKSFRLNPSVCVAPDTLVQLSSGLQRPIDELKNCWKESELLTFEENKNMLTKTELKKFWGLKPEEYGVNCYEITTKSGRKVVATGDHPFYTKLGLKETRKLEVGDNLILRPIDTPIYKEMDKVLVTEENIKKEATKETYIKHALKVLKDLKLLPLNLKDQRVLILARLIGHLFGDGTFILKKDTARLIFRNKSQELKLMQKDIESLGFNPGKIYIKTVENEIVTVKGKKLHIKGSGYDFEVRNKPLALLFAVLGAPNGDKAKLEYGIPKWIKDGPDFIQREFLASYFGCEMTKPKIRDTSDTNFNSLRFKISKIENKFNWAKIFVKGISDLLKNFSIKLSFVSEEEGNIRKDGNKTRVLIASIGDNRSIKNLFGEIGYVYSSEKDNIARLGYQYLIQKEKQIGKRKKDYKEVMKLWKDCKSVKKIMSVKKEFSRGQIEHWVYNEEDLNVGLQNTFVGFNDWIKDNANIKNGFVFDSIKNIKETYVPFVYDVTTTEPTHNFFVNGFLSSNCVPYNADFDGDEMNLHIPQTEEARSEADILMQVQTQIMSPKNGRNIIGCVEDAVTGNYLLTKYLEFSRKEAVEMLASIGIDNFSRLPKKEKINGRELISILLPKNFDFIGRSKNKKEVLIKKGELVEGIIDNNSIGDESGDLIREIYAEYGQETTLDFIGKIFRLGIKILLRNGFSTSISDTDLHVEIQEKIEKLLIEAEKNVNQVIEDYKNKKLEILPGKTLRDTLEVRILEILNKTRNKIGDLVAESNDDSNPTIMMARSGARGNILNLAQMAACVGQQALGGQRIKKGYRGRTLSLFKQGDLSASARGFVRGGFKSGLKPYEFFFHAMTGRDALMDTALRTPKSGYLYRRLANALQDLKVEYDGTVRDANKAIIQFKYGEDNIDVSKSEAGTIDVVKIIKHVIGEK